MRYLVTVIATIFVGLAAGSAVATPIQVPVTQFTTSGPSFPSQSPITMALNTGTPIGTLALTIQSVTGDPVTRIDADNGVLDTPVQAFARVFQPSDPCTP